MPSLALVEGCVYVHARQGGDRCFLAAKSSGMQRALGEEVSLLLYAKLGGSWKRKNRFLLLQNVSQAQ